MRLQNRYISVLCCAAFFAVVALPRATWAGFEWTPPENIEQDAIVTETMENPPEASFNAPPAQPVPPVFNEPLATPQKSSLPQSFMKAPAKPASRNATPESSDNMFQGKPLRRKRPELPTPLAPPVERGAAMDRNAKSVPVINLFPLQDSRAAQTRQATSRVEAPANAPAQVAYPDQESPTAPARRPKRMKQAVGFGQDIPLALAVSQIVPPEYPYSFSEKVDPGLRIDWQGGKPWDEVLEEGLAPHGLMATFADNAVMIMPESRNPLRTRSRTDVYRESAPSDNQVLFPEPLTALPPNSYESESSLSTLVATLSPAPSPAPDAQNPVQIMTAESRKRETPLQLLPDSNNPLFPQPFSYGPGPGSENMPEELQAPLPVQEVQSVLAMPADKVGNVASLEIKTGMVSSDPANPPIALEGRHGEGRSNGSARADIDGFYSWNAESGKTLRNVLSEWSDKAGVQLHWSSRYDYPLQSAISLEGTFTEAVELLLNGLMEANPRPVGELRPNHPDGPVILIVKTERIL